jgi:hypothetical protein
MFPVTQFSLTMTGLYGVSQESLNMYAANMITLNMVTSYEEALTSAWILLSGAASHVPVAELDRSHDATMYGQQEAPAGYKGKHQK